MAAASTLSVDNSPPWGLLSSFLGFGVCDWVAEEVAFDGVSEEVGFGWCFRDHAFGFVRCLWVGDTPIFPTAYCRLTTAELPQELLVAGFAEEVAGVEMAFAPGLFGGLGQLPVVEAGTEALADGLGVLGAFVVSEPVVGESEGLRQHPALAIVLAAKGVDAGLRIPAAGVDSCLQIVEGDQ